MTVAHWAKMVGLPLEVVSQRIKDGWSDDRVLTTPIVVKWGYNPLRNVKAYRRQNAG
jgi:hypothetical protein